jgi:linoleoyl-CoA desaturase
MEPIVHFSSGQDLEFKKVLNKRVDDYFRQTGLSRHYTPAMLWKTVVMLSLFFIPFGLVLTNLFPFWVNMVFYLVMGLGVAGIGMSVMHDGNHFSYSGNQRTNRLMGLTMNMIGADAYNWKIKHNKLHHVFTNIYGKDEDINSRAVLRFAYGAPLKKYHRFQHIYAWALYALMSLSMVFGDIPKRFNYRRRGLTNIPRARFRRSLVWLAVSKILYFGALLVLPWLVTDLSWWQVLLGFLLMQLVIGTILSLVFQMAHVVEGSKQVKPDASGQVNHSLIVHQLLSTADFSKNNKILSWYVGGLNYQVIHHLFPRVCHVHYPALAKIVEATTKEFGLPYHSFDSFSDAFLSHYRTLKSLGRVKI